MRTSYKSILLAISLLFTSSASISARPGDLDTTFGNGGIVVTPIIDGNNFYDEPNSMLVQPDGKILVCGQVLDDDSYGDTYTFSFFLVRYNSTGTLDTSFGTNGRVVPSGSEFVGKDIALQPDGKIVTVGFKLNTSSSYDFAVSRYNSNGSLDTSFGTGGKVVTPVGDSFEFAYRVAVQPDGKIIVAGYSFLGGNNFAFAVIRYNPDGSLDHDFGAGGTVITAIGSNYVLVSEVLLQPNGKIIIVGSSGINNLFTLVRYHADGSLDSEFGSNGKVIHSMGSGPAGFFAGVLQPDGKIVAAGHSNSRVVILRYNANGSIDTSFAANGIFRMETDFFWRGGIALQPNGKIVAFGNDETAGRAGFAVARLNPNGSLDASFGMSGRLFTPIGTDGRGASGGALQPDGRILAFGGIGNGDIAIARYLGDSVTLNPIDDAQFFVRQQYLDFLGREPDSTGLANWLATLGGCPNGGYGEFDNPYCDRIHVSAGFVHSQEFQGRGYWILRFGYVGLNRSIGSVRSSATYVEFTPALAQVGGSNSPAQEETAKVGYANAFVQRADFLALFPTTLTATQYLNALEANAAVTLSNKQALIAALNAGTMSRAEVLRNVVESQVVFDKYLIPAFVTMEYFGYLRRDPDPIGYQNWVNTLSADPSNYRHMIFGFIYSTEYRQRFGSN